MLEVQDIRGAFRQLLDQQPEIGVTKIISTWLFEPTHMFDPSAKKKPKPEVALALAYILLMAAVCAAFNLP